MAPADLSKAERLFRIARLLREGQLTVRDLAAKLFPAASVGGEGWAGIERALQRDLLDLERLEPEDFQRLPGRPPRYTLRTHRSTLHPVTLLALHAAARLMYHRAPGHRLHHQAALRQLTSWLPEQVQGVVGRGIQDIGKRRSREDINLEHACAAWTGGHPLRFEYRKPGGSGRARSNIIETYLIEAHPSNLDLYVIGRETTYHHAVRTFKLSRMKALHVLRDQTYTIPETFDPTAFLHGAWGVVGTGGNATMTVHLRFRHDAAYRILEGGYANLSEPYLNPDGTIDTTVEAPLDASGLPRELLPWILGWGPRVQVLGPPELRAHWQRELRAAAENADTEPIPFTAGGAA
ncbi:WYL domain-containing protein (plasmid) [Deinococcus metallilatus]|uniref:DNA-binding transcriptional regulator YafY n=1 Tax=Deinococcus metallilatus TaxID=1211322 RepID=A0AAJ5F5L4_9DEIO|nr:WYL domain-containing protein [Deinococcus metallilatus]MBB5293198.1 putative DNA-binding transcriptional regulator YafY [Deinococcus metallilatus]QBY06990.1 WYL domain-containing protein [Deinococcus metallilatus]RXJ18001.1 WYL domain-containing protein [Deinococcus metallilatus]TLK31937.1 WYL domain-containing protein [Deinococcus metallilatus]GMA15578.1 DNA-binding transcriptional regulator [Deinococcus metallilatus]